MTSEVKSEVRVGVRELKTHLSEYLRRVKAGDTLTITERGHEIACIRPCWEPQPKKPLEERIMEQVRAGKMQWSGRKLRPEPPMIHLTGKATVTDLLLEDRESYMEEITPKAHDTVR